jgi:hypothetical protein
MGGYVGNYRNFTKEKKIELKILRQVSGAKFLIQD